MESHRILFENERYKARQYDGEARQYGGEAPMYCRTLPAYCRTLPSYCRASHFFFVLRENALALNSLY